MAKLLSIKEVPNKYFLSEHFGERIKHSHVYDITVEDNHNYLANNLLVSNSGAKTYRDLNSKAWNDIYYKIGLTATPFRSRDEERLLLESVLSKVIYKIEYKKAVQSGYIVPLEAYYYDLPKKKIEGNKRSWSEMYSELVVHREDRNKLIATLAKNLTSQNISTLVLVKQIEHGAIIKKLCDDSIPFMKGENNEIENRIMLLEFNLKENTTLIGTNGVLGEGIDTKPAEFVIVGGLGKSKNAFMQQVGRVFRKYPGKESGKIILFRDTSHKWTLDHFNAQVQYLQDEYGITPIQLDLELV